VPRWKTVSAWSAISAANELEHALSGCSYSHVVSAVPLTYRWAGIVADEADNAVQFRGGKRRSTFADMSSSISSLEMVPLCGLTLSILACTWTKSVFLFVSSLAWSLVEAMERSRHLLLSRSIHRCSLCISSLSSLGCDTSSDRC